MRCEDVVPFEPSLENPYPDEDWSEITEFEYVTPLRLCRGMKAVQRRKGDDADYVVSEPYTVRFKLDGGQREITVPQGMLTDLSSVPAAARPLIGRVGPHLEASIVHDFLYIAWQDIKDRGARDEDREFADKLFRVGLETARVGRTRRFLIYNAVRWFGGGAFRGKDDRRYVKDQEDG